MEPKFVLLGSAIVAGCATLSATAQTSPLDQRIVEVPLDSGWVEAAGDERGVVYSTVITVGEESTWVRLKLDLAELGAAPPDGEPTELRLTSAWDGAVQTHRADTLMQWLNTSAYFNGPSVIVEIVADPGAGPSRLVTTWAWASPPVPGGIASICGEDDDRVPSNDPRAGRLMPQGCTVWMFDDANHCFLSAGHCEVNGGNVVEFNVPESLENGQIQHPAPEFQFVVDGFSVQDSNTGLGDDWAYFGCHPSTETGLTPAQTQGSFYVLATEVPADDEQDIRITGYGLDESPYEWNQVQQTHVGPYVLQSGSIIGYEVDTRSGNSGSAVLDETTGVAIGIHTNGGCGLERGNNSGTAVNNELLQDALANPTGVCVPEPQVEFAYPEGLPRMLDPDGDSLFLEIVPTRDGTPSPGTAFMGWQAGSGEPMTTPLMHVVNDLYQVEFPALACGTTINFHFSVDTADGETVLDPVSAPEIFYESVYATGLDFFFDDDFEEDLGWEVTDSPDLTTGSWERGIPAGFGDRGDPPYDADGSSRCFTTGLADGDNDVDEGSTTLTSPIMDASAGDPHITYYRWFSNVGGGEPNRDIMLVEISSDGGATWVHLETVGPGGDEVEGDWYFLDHRVADFVPQTNAFRIRFTVSDVGAGSIVEAGVDGVRLNASASGVTCELPCHADIDGDGEVGVVDLSTMIVQWGQAGSADINEDGITDVMDLVLLVLSWGPCP